MDQFFEFVTNHPYLMGSFAVLLALFIRNEMNRGGPSVTAQQLVDMVNKQGAVVLDVRDKKDFEAGHIVGALNVPYSSIESRVDELKKKFADKAIVVACKMGQQAGAAGTTLKKNGFGEVRRLKGGMMEWRNQNLPVVKKK